MRIDRGPESGPLKEFPVDRRRGPPVSANKEEIYESVDPRSLGYFVNVDIGTKSLSTPDLSFMRITCRRKKLYEVSFCHVHRHSYQISVLALRC